MVVKHTVFSTKNGIGFGTHWKLKYLPFFFLKFNRETKTYFNNSVLVDENIIRKWQKCINKKSEYKMENMKRNTIQCKELYRKNCRYKKKYINIIIMENHVYTWFNECVIEIARHTFQAHMLHFSLYFFFSSRAVDKIKTKEPLKGEKKIV